MSPLMLTMTPALSAKGEVSKDAWRRNATRETKLTFEVEEVTFSSANWLALADNDGWHDLLSELGLTLLDTSEEHISDRASWEAVKSGADASAGNHEQVLSSSVVCAVHDCTDWQTV